MLRKADFTLQRNNIAFSVLLMQADNLRKWLNPLLQPPLEFPDSMDPRQRVVAVFSVLKSQNVLPRLANVLSPGSVHPRYCARVLSRHMAIDTAYAEIVQRFLDTTAKLTLDKRPIVPPFSPDQFVSLVYFSLSLSLSLSLFSFIFYLFLLFNFSIFFFIFFLKRPNHWERIS